MTRHVTTGCPVCKAISLARDLVVNSGKQDAAIPVILSAVGWDKSPRPWPAAVKALKEHAKSMLVSPAIARQAAKLDAMDAELAALKRVMSVHEPNSKYVKDLNKVLVHNQQVFDREVKRMGELKAAAGISGSLAAAEQAIEMMGLVDLLGLKTSDLAAAKRPERKVEQAPRPVIRRVCATDVAKEYGLVDLTETDRRVVATIVYLRNLFVSPMVRVKRHSKPRKRASIDEGRLKEALVYRRPAVQIRYATAELPRQVTVLR